MNCPECGEDGVRKENDGRNILIRCMSCGLVIDDELIV